MKNTTLFLKFVFTFCVLTSFVLSAQVQQGHINQNKFRQLYDQFADPNKYHNASGAPGVEYYQQKVDYVMNVELR
jgi:hypothetical protein